MDSAARTSRRRRCRNLQAEQIGRRRLGIAHVERRDLPCQGSGSVAVAIGRKMHLKRLPGRAMTECGVQAFEKRRRIWLICCCDTGHKPKGYATTREGNLIELEDRAGSIHPLTEPWRASARQLLRKHGVSSGIVSSGIDRLRYRPVPSFSADPCLAVPDD